MMACSSRWSVLKWLMWSHMTSLCLSIVIQSVPFSLPPPPQMTGSLTPNSILYDAERLHDKQIPSPHSYAMLHDQVFAVTKDSLVVNVGGCRPSIVADLKPRGCRGDVRCGALRSIRVGPRGLLLVVDAYRGLFQVHPVSGVVHLLFDSSTPVNGRPSVYLNDAAILPDGTILISDSSSRFGLEDEFWIRFEGRTDGRLIAVNPTTGKTTEVMADLAYPNGLELTFDSSSVLVSETGRARIIRVDLRKEHLYRRTVFASNLPGMPEHIRKSDKGSYWVGITYPRFAGSLSPMDEYSAHPSSRNILAKHQTKEQLQRMMSRRGLVVELNEQGDVTGSLHDSTGRRVSHVTEVTAKDGIMYIGTRDQDAILRVVIADSPSHKMSSEARLQLLFTRCRISESQYRMARDSLKSRQPFSAAVSLATHSNGRHVAVQTQTYTHPMMPRGRPHQQVPWTKHASAPREITHNGNDFNIGQSPWIIPQGHVAQYTPHSRIHHTGQDAFPRRIVQGSPDSTQPIRQHRGDTVKYISPNEAFALWRPTVSQNLLRANGHYQEARIDLGQIPHTLYNNEHILRLRNMQPTYPMNSNRNTSTQSNNTPNGNLRGGIHTHNSPLNNLQEKYKSVQTSRQQYDSHPLQQMPQNPHPRTTSSFFSRPPGNTNRTPDNTRQALQSSSNINISYSNPSQGSKASSKSHSAPTQVHNKPGEITLPFLGLGSPATSITTPPFQSATTAQPNVRVSSKHVSDPMRNNNDTTIYRTQTHAIPGRHNTTAADNVSNHVTITINIHGDYFNKTSTNSPITEKHQNKSNVSTSSIKRKYTMTMLDGSKPDPNQILLESPGHENRNFTKRQTRPTGMDSLFNLLKSRRRPPHMETPNENTPSQQLNEANASPNKVPSTDHNRMVDLQRRLGQLRTNIQKFSTPNRGTVQTNANQSKLQMIRNMMTANRRRQSPSSQTQRQIIATQPVSRQHYSLIPVASGGNKNQILLGNSRARNTTAIQTVSGAARSPLFHRLASARNNAVRKMQSLRSRTPTATKSNDVTKYIEVVSGTGRIVRVPVHPRLLQRILLKRLENTLKSKSQ